MRQPALFLGHGSPMVALESNAITANFSRLGKQITARYGKPKAILSISAHWFTRGQWVQSGAKPRQIYDMYGFPEALYQVNYEPDGDPVLARRVEELLGSEVATNDEWGLDHGSWSVLVHLFPEADVPVVQLSVDGAAAPEAVYELGRKLAPLREEGYLLLGSGNNVHNLRATDWQAEGGSEANRRFDRFIVEALRAGEYGEILDYRSHPDAGYAVPTVDHFYPLLYILGATEGDEVTVFNQVGTLASISMSSFVFTEGD